MHSKVRNIPRNTQLRGRLFDKWPRKGLSGACCGPSGEVSGAPTGRGPACSAARDRGGTGSSEVQTGRAGRRVAKKVFRREDAPAARTQKKCSEGKVRRRPNTYGHKKNGPRSVHFYFCYSATLRASAPGCSSDTPCRTTTAPHSGSPSLLRETSGSMFSCNSLSAFDFGLPVGRGHSRESLRHPEPQPLSRPPVGAQPPGRRNLSRPGSPRESRSRSGRPRESRRPPPGSQFSAARVTVLSRRGHSSQPPSGPISQPPGVSAVRSPELAVPAARPLRRRGHSTTTSVWPSTCNWRISCVELT